MDILLILSILALTFIIIFSYLSKKDQRVIQRETELEVGWTGNISELLTGRSDPTASLPSGVRFAIPIVEDASDVEPGGEFRLEKDAEDVIRIRRKRPPQATLPTILIKDVPVAGVSRPEAVKNVIAFIAGKDRSLALVRDRANRFDKNAIKVIGKWKDRGAGSGSAQLGWVPRATAREIAQDKELEGSELYASLRTIFLPSSGKSPGLRFDIWA